MPRLSPSLLRTASAHSQYLPLLLPACRTLEQAKQELKWIKTELPKDEWTKAIISRSQLKPLQYILGTQPFGELDIKCREKVLVPRWETEEWCSKLVDVLQQTERDRLRILDVCTGTGCIPLLIGSKLKRSVVKGVDISQDCIDLAIENRQYNGVDNVDFLRGNVFDESVLNGEKYDFVTSNPPYIPLKDYESSEIEKSVRLYEPKLALVGEDEFYEALVKNVVLPSNSQGFIFELGYRSQFEYTRSLLSDEWETRLFWDSNEKPRCVIGWKKNGPFEQLENFTTERI